MHHNEKVTEILNDLVRINLDRIHGYEQAIEDLEDGDQDLKSVFQEKISQSRMYSTKLGGYINTYGGDPVTDTTISGKLYRVWMDFKASLTNHDRSSVLNSCVFGENAALEAYETAINDAEDLPNEILSILTQQRDSIQSSHMSIKSMADLEEQVTH